MHKIVKENKMYFILVIYYEKRWAGGSTSWNQD